MASGRLRTLLYAQQAHATRNATAQQPLLHVAHPRECNTQQPEGGGENPPTNPEAEARRQRVLAKLAGNPARRIAVVCDGEGDPVPVAVGIRHKGTCEVHIPAARFDPFALLDLVAQHGGTVH